MRLAVPKKYGECIEGCLAAYGHCADEKHLMRVLAHLTWEYGLELPDLINRLHPDHRPTIMLHPGDMMRGIPTVWLLGWSQHETTGMHGHGASAAAIAVLQGTIINDLLLGEPGIDVGVPSIRQWVRKGSIFTLPKGAIHDVGGTADDPAARDVTVHAYWPPLAHMDYYDHAGKWTGAWTEAVELQAQESLE